MRVLIKLIVFCTVVIALLFAGTLLWLYYDSRDLPDIGVVASFSPMKATTAYDLCWKHESVVIPYDSIGNNLRNALNAVDVRENDPSILTATYRSFTGSTMHRATLSMQISRTLFCTPSKMLHRNLAELRAAAQLERRFSRRELFTIFANRVYFGQDLIGVEAAARQFFDKEPDNVSVGEASLLAGLIKSPSLYSPLKHPDRALSRRNEVIDAMVASGTIKASEAKIAKASPLGIATDRHNKN